MRARPINKTLKLGSLFDGSGTCQLAAVLCGIVPIWASEIEKFPIEVTKKRFPNTQHLGDITKINGAEIAPVDIITFGSPCQDLSIAGKRAGLDGSRSNLFMEAIRIIREMREATNNEYPRFICWENVPGAFSSNKGNDFRTVLKEIAESDIPMPEGGKWASAGMVELSDRQIAWRVLDAQHWGVPQRRKRIFLVADFNGKCAGEVLFEPEGMFGNYSESGETGEGIAEGIERGFDSSSGFGETGIGYWQCGIQTLRAEGENRPSRPSNVIVSAIPINTQIATRHNALGERTGLGIGNDGDPAFTLQEAHSHGVAVMYPQNTVGSLIARADGSPCVDRGQPFVITAGFMAGQGAKAGGIGYQEEVSPTLKSVLSGGNTVPSIVTYPDIAGILCASGAGLSRPAGQCNETDLCIVQAKAINQNADGEIRESDVAYTINTNGNPSGRNAPLVYSFDSLASNSMKSNNPCSGCREVDIAKTIDTSSQDPSKNQGGIAVVNKIYGFCPDNSITAGGVSCEEEKSMTLSIKKRLGICYAGRNTDAVAGLDCRNGRENGDICGTLQAKGGGGFSYNCTHPVRIGHVVRRLTPTECARLQGFPDCWCADIPHSDTAEYKLWGNGMSLPCVLFIIQGIANVYRSEGNVFPESLLQYLVMPRKDDKSYE